MLTPGNRKILGFAGLAFMAAALLFEVISLIQSGDNTIVNKLAFFEFSVILALIGISLFLYAGRRNDVK